MDIADCLKELDKALTIRGRTPDTLTHAFEALSVGAAAKLEGFKVDFEEAVRVRDGKKSREIDVVLRDALNDIVARIEVKSAETLKSVLSAKGRQQLMLDLLKILEDDVLHVWALTNEKIQDDFMKRINETLREMVPAILGRLVGQGMALEEASVAMQKALGKIGFIKGAGRVLLEAIEKNSDAILRPTVDALLGPDKAFAKAFLHGATHSPNLEPAVRALLGPRGLFAEEVTTAARRASLQAASESLEEKIEQSVGGAIRQAGDGVAGSRAREIADRIGDRASALGDALSSIPQLHRSVKELGDAWNQPPDSTEAYMSLLSAAGSTIGDAGNVIQKLTMFTGLASSAQALFNIVLSANPIGLVVLAIVALIAEIALLIAYWDEIRAALRDNPWIGVIASLFTVVGAILLVIAHWEEVKLAVLVAANFISVQAQRIAHWIVGVGQIFGQVWGVVVASLESAGVSILNGLTTMGVGIQNFFIGIINWILEKYNALADTAAGRFARLTKSDLLPEVELQAHLLPLPEVPVIDVEAAFGTPEIAGGLEGRIADQERAVAAARAEDEARRAGIAAPESREAAREPSIPGLPDISRLRAAGAGERPAVPEGALAPQAAAAGGGPVTVHLGGVTVNIDAERLEANASQILSDDIVRALSERLGSLLAEQNFRMGTRPA